MAFTKLTKDMNIIQKLEDEPNDVGGMTSAELKAKFDEPANAVKDWINKTFIPEAEQELRRALLGQIPDGTVTQKKLAGGTVSNPNLLDNWYFADPINQRGQTEYAENGAYTVDRWFLSRFAAADTGYSASVTADGIALTGGDNYAFLMQPLEPEASKALYGRTVTLSALVDGALCSGTGTVPDVPGTGNVTVVNKVVGNYAVQLIMLPSGLLRVHLRALAGSTVVYQAVKLELGAVQTLVHQDSSGTWVLNDPPHDRTTELLKCQRYFYRLECPETASAYVFLGVVKAASAVGAFLPITLPVEMRSNPAISVSDIGKVSMTLTAADAGVELTDVTGAAQNGRNSRLLLSGTTEAGAVYLVWLKQGAYIDFDAEL